MPDRSSKHLRDPNLLAKLVVDIATGGVEDHPLTPEGKDAVAVALGRRGPQGGTGPSQQADVRATAGNRTIGGCRRVESA